MATDIEDLAVGGFDVGRHGSEVHALGEVEPLQAALLQWYTANRRKFPWRGDDGYVVTPYHTWVSEVMAQQTRVDVVVKYFRVWVEKFPTVEALAAADLEDVNQVWAGLGYYRRAKNLHDGARMVMKDFGGVLPTTVAGLRKIPSIGEYTAGAIASLAHGVATPCVDGNVVRVLSRLLTIAADAKNPALAKHCWAVSGKWVPADRPGDFNQAVMELGATVCTPKSPKCGGCPIRAHCGAFKLVQQNGGGGLVPPPPAAAAAGAGTAAAGVGAAPVTPDVIDLTDDASPPKANCTLCATDREDALALKRGVATAEAFPLKAMKKKPREETVAVCVVESRVGDGSQPPKFLLVQRPKKGLLAGQWEPPCVVMPSTDATPDACLASASSFCEQALGVEVFGAVSEYRGAASHVFSHIKQSMHVHVATLPAADEPPAANPGRTTRWATADEFSAVGLTTWACKVLCVALQGHLPAGSPGLLHLQSRAKLPKATKKRSPSASRPRAGTKKAKAKK